MRTMQQWLDEYGESHQNKTNKAVHWVCVPVIFFSLMGLLSLIPIPIANPSQGFGPYLHIGTAAIVLGLLFYLRISVPIAAGMALFSAFVLYAIKVVNLNMPDQAWIIYVALFVVAWIVQFIGHKIEGAKPSFLEDVQFLMIGPAWLMHFIFKKLGLKY